MSELHCVLWPDGAPDPEPGLSVALEPDESHHLIRVRRVREGEEVWAVVGDGRGLRCELETGPDGARVRVREIVEQWREPPVRITLYQAQIRPAALEQALSGGTALGLAAFVPVLTERVERGRVRTGRLERIAAEAAKQCGRGLIPSVSEPRPWSVFLPEAVRFPLLVADDDGYQSLGDVGRELRARGVDDLGLLIGPEGGLSRAERDDAEAAGARIVHCGARRLRSETAAVAALSILLCEDK